MEWNSLPTSLFLKTYNIQSLKTEVHMYFGLQHNPWNTFLFSFFISRRRTQYRAYRGWPSWCNSSHRYHEKNKLGSFIKTLRNYRKLMGQIQGQMQCISCYYIYIIMTSSWWHQAPLISYEQTCVVYYLWLWPGYKVDHRECLFICYLL